MSSEIKEPMSWNQLRALLDDIPPERRNDTAIIYLTNSDEFLPIPAILNMVKETDVLDKGAVYLEADFWWNRLTVQK